MPKEEQVKSPRVNLTRRQVTARAGALVALGYLGSAATATAQTPGASPVSGDGWSYTDARGLTIEVPQRPVRVVAQTFLAQSLYDFGYEVAGHFGVDNAAGGFQSSGDLDLDTIPFLGVFGEYDIEMLLSLRADLVLDFSYGLGEEAAFWYLDPESIERILPIVPILGVSMAGTSIDDNIASVRDLAAALGADVETPDILADIESFKAAAEGLAAVTEAHPGIRVLALQGTAEEVYLANPDWHSDLIYFQELGVSFTPFTVDEGGAPFWGTFSSEVLGTLPTDLYLTIGDLSGIPVWETLPAVKAHQTGEWRFSTRVSYRGFTTNLTELTDIIASASVVAS